VIVANASDTSETAEKRRLELDRVLGEVRLV
jgi:hypothetical protein